MNAGSYFIQSSSGSIFLTKVQCREFRQVSEGPGENFKQGTDIIAIALSQQKELFNRQLVV
jgi:hypothetical protein